MRLPLFLSNRLPVPCKACAQFGGRRMACGIARHDRDIDRRKRMLVQTKGLSGDALHFIAGNGAAESAGRYREAEARMSCTVGQNRQGKINVGYAPTALPQFAKLLGRVQALTGREREPGRRPRALRQGSYGQSRLRPLARRRASTRRPALVDMRARKPCVRARCRLLGLNVRFIAGKTEDIRGYAIARGIRERRQG